MEGVYLALEGVEARVRAREEPVGARGRGSGAEGVEVACAVVMGRRRLPSVSLAAVVEEAGPDSQQPSWRVTCSLVA